MSDDRIADAARAAFEPVVAAAPEAPPFEDVVSTVDRAPSGGPKHIPLAAVAVVTSVVVVAAIGSVILVGGSRDGAAVSAESTSTTNDTTIIPAEESPPTTLADGRDESTADHLQLDITDRQPAWGGIDFLVLRNTGTEPIDLSGWQIRSRGFRTGLLVPDGTTIDPGRSIAVYEATPGEVCPDDTPLAFFSCNVFGDDRATTELLFPIPIIEVVDRDGSVVLPERDGTTVTTTHVAELSLDIDAPTGEFVITHLRAFMTVEASPGATVTINGDQVVEVDSGTFSYEWWLELGRNSVHVVATTPEGDTREMTLQPHVLPNASTFSGYILDTNAEPIARAIAFDDAEFVSLTDPDTKLLPPTLLELSSRAPNAGGLTVVNPDTTTRALRVDPHVVFRIKDPTSEGTDLITVSLDRWEDSWSATQPYWVTVHNGVVVQIAEAHPGN